MRISIFFIVNFVFFSCASTIANQEKDFLQNSEKFNQFTYSIDSVVEFCPESFDTLEKEMELNSYDWNWESYVSKIKYKLSKSWKVPMDYYLLDLIGGYTKLTFEIDSLGNLKSLCVNKHIGNINLLKSSIDAIKSIFPMDKLPSDFPNETLTIILKMVYPDLRKDTIYNE